MYLCHEFVDDDESVLLVLCTSTMSLLMKLSQYFWRYLYHELVDDVEPVVLV